MGCCQFRKHLLNPGFVSCMATASRPACISRYFRIGYELRELCQLHVCFVRKIIWFLTFTYTPTHDTHADPHTEVFCPFQTCWGIPKIAGPSFPEAQKNLVPLYPWSRISTDRRTTNISSNFRWVFFHPVSKAAQAQSWYPILLPPDVHRAPFEAATFYGNPAF